MQIEDIYNIIIDAHENGDTDSEDGIVNICKEIAMTLDCDDGDYWTESAMLGIAQRAYECGLDT